MKSKPLPGLRTRLRSRPLSWAVGAVWGVGLAAVVAFRATAAPGAPPVVVESSLSADLLTGSRTAIVLVSARCDVCVGYPDRIVEALFALDVDQHLVVASLGEPTEVLEAIGYPEGVVRMLPREVIEEIRMGFVPAFVIVEDGVGTPIWLGIPNPIQVWLQRWQLRRRISS